MRLNKKEQYALLFALYLQRSGKTTCEAASESLKIPQNFLFHIASAMRKKGVVKTTRGPGGGYELSKGATVLQILNSVGFDPVITVDETKKYVRGTSEERAFVTFVGQISTTLKTLFDLPVEDLNSKLVHRELSQLDNVSEARAV